MAVGTAISVDEYLRTSYSPDCDYLDGEAVERNLGEKRHSIVQREILFYLAARYPKLRRLIFPEQRVQVGATRFRVPDICVLSSEAPDEEIVRTPPILCIEILSPEDTMTRTLGRVKDYLDMGVPACWIVDLESRDGILRAGGIEMPIAEIFEEV